MKVCGEGGVLLMPESDFFGLVQRFGDANGEPNIREGVDDELVVLHARWG